MQKILAKTIAVCTLLPVMSIAPAVFAYEAGDVVLRAGVTLVAPDSAKGDVIVPALGGDTGMHATVDNNAQLGLNVAYFFTSQWAIELLAATPFSHSVNLEDTVLDLSDGDLADVKHLPPTLSAIYYFRDVKLGFNPYVGLGLNYTVFFDEEFTDFRKAQGFSDLSLDDSWGLAWQVGADFNINENWSVNGSIRYIDIETTAEFNVGENNGYVDVAIDPFVATLSVGYTF